MPQPLVSIVTPSYNQAAFLGAAIESVLAQDYPGIELIVVDGGSSDSSAAVASRYKDRLTWISEPDRGQSHAINKGFGMARGDVLAWLNSDDLLLPGAVSSAVAAFQRHPYAAAVYGGGWLIDSEGRRTGPYPHAQMFNLWRLLHRSFYILQPGSFFRADALREAGPLREDLHYTMDWDLFLRIARRRPLHYIPEPLACQRVHAAAKTSAGGLERLAEIRRTLRCHTGARFPAAWVPYAAHTYASSARDLLRRLFPGPLRPAAFLLQTTVTALFAALAWFAARESQGIDPLGWAGPRLLWLLPPGHGSLEIEGDLPASGWLAGQAIEVRCDGRSLGSHLLSPGPFRLSLPCGPRPPEAAARVEIRASHCYLPPEPVPNPAPRRLSYRLRYIGWSSWRDELPLASSPFSIHTGV